MTVVGEATVVVRYDSSRAAAGLEAQTEADLAGLSDGAAVAGATAGEELRSGVAKGSEGLADDAANAGLLAGTSLRGGVKDASEGIADDLAKTGEKGGIALADSLGTGKLSVVEDVLGTLGVSMGGVSDRGDRMARAAEKGGLSIRHMADNAGVSEPAFLAMAGGVAAVVGGAIDLGVHMQEATDKVANSAQISDDAAKKITDAFSGMAGHSEEDGAALATAYAGVAGQLGSLQGKALTAAQAVHVMTAAQNLGEATNTDLSTSTSTLASVMQAYQVPVKDAAAVSDQLYVASQRTGLGVAGVGAAAAKVKTGLGAMAPPLSQVSGLLVDMADHGETGRKGLSLLTSAFTTFLKPAADVATAQAKVKVSMDALPPSLKGLAQSYSDGKVTYTEFLKATEGLSPANAALVSQFESSKTAMDTARQAADQMGITTVNNQGKFVGMRSVLAQLNEQVKGMSDAQATAKLQADGFGSSSAKLLTIVQAGPDAFDKATAAVTKHGTAADAASKQQHTLDGEFKTLETTVKDVGEDFGTILVPALTDVAGVGAEVLSWVVNTEPAAIALGAAVGIGLGIPVARFAANTAKDFIGSLVGMGQGAVNLGAKMLGLEPVFATTQTAEEKTAAALQSAAASMSASAEQISASLTAVGTASAEMAGEVEASGVAAGAAIESIGTTAETVGPEAGLAFDSMLGPIGLVGGAIGLLVGAFGVLGGHESAEAQAADQVTASKNRETTAIQNATNAALASDSASLQVKAAQEQLKTSQDAVTAARDKYGAKSPQYMSALVSERQSLVGLRQAQQDAAQAQQAATDKATAEVAGARKVVDATEQQVNAAQKQVDADRTVADGIGKVTRSSTERAEITDRLKAAEGDLTAKEQAHDQAVLALTADTATAAATELNHQRALQGTTQITGEAASKVQALSGIYAALPKNVQTKLAADPTDALEKISGLVSQLKPIVGTQQIVKILGDSSNAQDAISQLTGLLDSLPAAFTTIGKQASQGLANGLDAGIAGVTTAAARLSNAATVSAKVSLKSHSPSLVFHQIGTDVGQGFSDGIESSTTRARASVRKLISTITADGKTYTLPVPMASPATAPTLEPAGAATTAADAAQAPSAATASAEQAWATAATQLSQAIATSTSNAEHSEAQAVQNAATKQTAAIANAAAKHVAAIQSAEQAIKKATADQRNAAAQAEQAVKSSATQQETAVKQAASKKETVDKAAAAAEAKVAQQGASQLNTLISAITSGSQSQLNSAMSGITEKQMAALVGKLDATHNKQLQAMAGQIETAWKQGMDALAQANEIAANTAGGTIATDTANANAKMTADTQAVANDATAAVTQHSADFTQLATDAASQLGQTVASTTDGMQQQINAALAQNQKAVAAGVQLTAAQAATALDQVTMTQNQAVAAQQQKLDQDTTTSDQQIGQLQQNVDNDQSGSLQQSQDQLALTKAQAAQTTELASDNAALSAAQQTAAAAEQTAKNTQTIASAVSQNGTGAGVTYVFNLEGSGQTTTADWINEIGIAMTVGTLPPATPNPGLPNNQALVAA